MSVKRALRSLRLPSIVVVVGIMAAAIASTIFNPFGESATPVSANPGLGDMSHVARDRSQVDALADGRVTRAELDAQKDRTLACAEAAGLEVVYEEWQGYADVPKWLYIFKGPQPTTSGPGADDECWVKFSRDVDLKWVEQNQPSEAKRNSNRQAALECAKDENLAVSDVKAVIELAKSGGNRGAQRCAIIATKGYDINEHPLPVID